MSSNGEDFPTVIGPDAVFKGDLSFEKGVKHLGRFEGTIQTKGHLEVAQGAKLSGDVEAGSINVHGEVRGNLHAVGKVCLAETAKLEGDLHTAKLEVAEGAVFVGRCVVGPNGVPKAGDVKGQRPVAKDQAAAQQPAGKKQ